MRGKIQFRVDRTSTNKEINGVKNFTCFFTFLWVLYSGRRKYKPNSIMIFFEEKEEKAGFFKFKKGSKVRLLPSLQK